MERGEDAAALKYSDSFPQFLRTLDQSEEAQQGVFPSP